MRSRQRIVTGLVFLVVSAGAALGQTNGTEADALLAADAAWLKVYQARDLAKWVAFCDHFRDGILPGRYGSIGR
jgi:hypothetical protein